MPFNEIKKNISYFIGNDLEFVIVAGVVFILLVFLLIYRSVRNSHIKQSIRNVPPAILHSDAVAEKKPPEGLAAVMTSLYAQENEEKTRNTTPLSMDETNEGGRNLTAAKPAAQGIDEAFNLKQTPDMNLNIPRLGESEPLETTEPITPPRKKRSIFSFGSKKEKETSDIMPVSDIMNEIAINVTAELPSNAQLSEEARQNQKQNTLQEIERQMKALRELHDAGLIASEIYLHKSRELAGKV